MKHIAQFNVRFKCSDAFFSDVIVLRYNSEIDYYIIKICLDNSIVNYPYVDLHKYYPKSNTKYPKLPEWF